MIIYLTSIIDKIRILSHDIKYLLDKLKNHKKFKDFEEFNRSLFEMQDILNEMIEKMKLNLEKKGADEIQND